MRDRFLPYCNPHIDEAEIAAVATCLRNGWLTTGPVVREFEAEFAQRSGVRHAIAVSSCTAALHAGLVAMNVGPGDEVVMPSLTFVAGAQCALEIGATPVFADIDAKTLSVTVESIDAVVTSRTKVIMPMPYGGRPLDIAAIVRYARERNILVLEDGAHAAGMLDRGQWCGAQSDAAAYSFYATKNLTSAEGGMLLTNDDRIAERVRRVSLHGMDKDAWKRYTASGSWRYDVLEPGFKYNLADPLAALGLGQLHRLEIMQQRRDEIAARYDKAFGGLEGIELQAAPCNAGDKHSWCMYVILVDPQRIGISRDAMIDALRARNIGTSVHYIPTHLFTAYQHLTHANLASTRSVWERLISLPLHPGLSDGDVDDVVEAVSSLAPNTALIS